MSNHSVIEHRANYHFIKVEEDYLAICSQGKTAPHCKALILSILEHWTNTKRDQEQGDYIYMSMPQWIAATYQLYERNIITACLQELVKDKMIERRAIIMYAQKTFDYRLCIDTVQELIRALPAKDHVLPNLTAYQDFKQRQKEARVREKSRTPSEASEKSPGVREKSRTVGDKSRRVREKSPKVREKSTQHRLTKNNLNSSSSSSSSPSPQAQDDPVAGDAQKPARIELSAEQKQRARALKTRIDDRCGQLAERGPAIAENKAIAVLVQRYADADIDDVLHYLEHCHFKWSKPDFKFHIRGNILLAEMEPTLKLFAEQPRLRNATEPPPRARVADDGPKGPAYQKFVVPPSLPRSTPPPGTPQALVDLLGVAR